MSSADIWRISWRAGTIELVDTEDTQLMLETLFDITVRVREIHEVIVEPEDEDEEEEEEDT